MPALSFSRQAALSFFAALALAALPAQAGLDESKFSETEKAGFAFYYFSKSRPDFESWIKNSEEYHQKRPLDRVSMLKQDVARLETGLIDYHPEENPLHVMADATLRRVSLPSQKFEPDEKPVVELIMKNHKDMFFPYRVGEFWIAVIPEDMEVVTRLVMPQDEYRKLLQATRLSVPSHRTTSVVLELDLRPVSADSKSPITIRGQEYWAMMTKVGRMVLWDDKRKKILWNYQAQNYKSVKDREMMELYQD